MACSNRLLSALRAKLCSLRDADEPPWTCVPWITSADECSSFSLSLMMSITCLLAAAPVSIFSFLLTARLFGSVSAWQFNHQTRISVQAMFTIEHIIYFRPIHEKIQFSMFTSATGSLELGGTRADLTRIDFNSLNPIFSISPSQYLTWSKRHYENKRAVSIDSRFIIAPARYR